MYSAPLADDQQRITQDIEFGGEKAMAEAKLKHRTGAEASCRQQGAVFLRAAFSARPERQQTDIKVLASRRPVARRKQVLHD